MIDDGTSTPYLLMDLDAVSAAHRGLTRAMPDARIHFAVTANPLEAVLRRLYAHGTGFTIASLAELDALRPLGVDAADVLFSHPVKVPAHIEAAAAAGVWRFAVDSISEVDKVAAAAPGSAVYVRLRAEAVDGTGTINHFGIEAEQAARVMRHAAASGLQPYGVTFHIGVTEFNTAVWEAPVAATGQVMRDLLGDGIRLRMLNLGGGMFTGAPGGFRPHRMQITSSISEHLPYPVDLVIEPGRDLVARAGAIVTTVIGTAFRAGQWWAHLDVGVGNGAADVAHRFLCVASDSRSSPGRRRWQLAGPSGGHRDVVGVDVHLSADLRAGDRVFLHSAGAYSIPAVRFPALTPRYGSFSDVGGVPPGASLTRPRSDRVYLGDDPEWVYLGQRWRDAMAAAQAHQGNQAGR